MVAVGVGAVVGTIQRLVRRMGMVVVVVTTMQMPTVIMDMLTVMERVVAMKVKVVDMREGTRAADEEEAEVAGVGAEGVVVDGAAEGEDVLVVGRVVVEAADLVVGVVVAEVADLVGARAAVMRQLPLNNEEQGLECKCC